MSKLWYLKLKNLFFGKLQRKAASEQPKNINLAKRDVNMYTVDDLRLRLNRQGWVVRELPIKSGGVDHFRISGYKVVAIKGDKSVTCQGKTLEEGMKNLCKTLGTISEKTV